MIVSVVVPTYNRAHMIASTLRSIQAQTYRDLEVIVIDDGSQDATEEVVLGIAQSSDIPIRYLKKENGGCSSARNAGVGIATGDAIAFLDSDDQFTPNAIESLLTVMVSTGADFVYSPNYEVTSRGMEWLSLPAAHGHPERFAREHFLTMRARCCCLLYRRNIFDLFRFAESERYNEDSDFLQRVAITFTAAYSPVPTARVFQHGENKSSNRKEIYLALIRSHFAILSEFPAFEKSLGDLASKRLDELRKNLAESLVAEREFTQAGGILRDLVHKPLLLTASVCLNSTFPLFVLRLARRGAHSVRRRLHVLVRFVAG